MSPLSHFCEDCDEGLARERSAWQEDEIRALRESVEVSNQLITQLRPQSNEEPGGGGEVGNPPSRYTDRSFFGP